jgi:hypothetical protein
MRKTILLITISESSYDYDILLSYLWDNSAVESLSIIAEGLLVRICYNTSDELKKILSNIIKLDVDDVKSCEIMYEEFLPGKYHRYRNID